MWTNVIVIAVFVCAMASKFTPGAIRRMGRYNRELSARWSFWVAIFKGVLLSGRRYYSVSTVLYKGVRV